MVEGLGELAGDKGETTMANRETHVLNPAWPGLVAVCGRRVAVVSPVCASAPESASVIDRACAFPPR